MKIQGFEKGVSVYLSLIIMMIVLAIGLGLATIIISQISTTRGMGNSVVAFYAADTGIEHILYNMRRLDDTSDLADIPLGEGSYDAEYSQDISKEFLRSVGYYKGTQRAIQTDQSRSFDFLFSADATYFCASKPGESEHTTLRVSLVSGGPKDVTFEVQSPPSGVTPVFDPLSGTLSSENQNFDVDFYFQVGDDASEGTSALTLNAYPDATSNTPIPITLEIPCPP